MKKLSLLILVFLLVLTVGCTSAVAIEPIQPTGDIEVIVQVEEPRLAGLAKIENPNRFIKNWPVDPFNGQIGLLNSTGYTLTLFDLFSLTMYEGQNEQGNLLHENLDDGRQVLISLDEHPILKSVLASSPAPQFVYNALDSDGDLYWGVWNPNTDAWNIVLTLDAFEGVRAAEDVVSFGPIIVIANNTGYPIQQLYLEHKSAVLMDGSELNLLGNQLLEAGQKAIIATDDLSHLSEYLDFDAYATLNVIAFDTDGDRYILRWYPSTDLWYIDLTFDYYRYTDEQFSSLIVENATGQSIWYLYAVTEEGYASRTFSYDYLTSSVLGSDQSIEIDLSDDQTFQSQNDTTIHVVAKSQDGTLYHKRYNPSLDPAYIRFTSDDREFISSDQSGVIVLENETGNDLWFLYLVTDEMLRSNVFGLDLLGPDIWKDGALFNFSSNSIPESGETSGISLIAFDYDDQLYRKPLSLMPGSDLLTFTREDLQISENE